jgi:biopolymer transport protein ExbD
VSDTWKIRHEGSPTSMDGLSQAQVLEGLADGLWEPTDEVMGPGESEWVALENHPQLAEAAEDLEPPPPRRHDDETRLDMTALIDVTMVMLIFFILTTSYAAMQKLLEAPSAEKDPTKGVPVLKKEDVENSMILVSANMEGAGPPQSRRLVLRVQGKEVDPATLSAELRTLARANDRHTLVLEHDDYVPQDVVVKIIDDAKGAGLNKVRLVVP